MEVKRRITKLEAIQRLRKLRDQIPDQVEVPAQYGYELHEILDDLTETGVQISRFVIPPKEFRQKIESANYQTGQKTFRTEKVITMSEVSERIEACLEHLMTPLT
jgi:hypothetical protein